MFMIIHDICISYLFFVLPTDLVLEPATHRFILKDFRAYNPWVLENNDMDYYI